MALGAARQSPRGCSVPSAIKEPLAGTSTHRNTTSTTTTDIKPATTAAASRWRWLLWPSSSLRFLSWSSEASASRSRRKHPLVVPWNVVLAMVTCAWLASPARFGANGQPERYLDGAGWKVRLSDGIHDDASWFARWNAMVQPRIDQLAFLAEGKVPYRKKDGGENGTRLDNDENHREPYRVTMVGDSTMMQQFGVICAFLAERAGRRFDPAGNRKECCVDTLPRHRQLLAGTNDDSTPGDNSDDNSSSSSNSSSNNGEDPWLSVGRIGGGAEVGGGRGLCFRNGYEYYADPPKWESVLGSPDAVYFGTGLHYLHMVRPGHKLHKPAVERWMDYEHSLENAVNTYRAKGGDGFRLIFTTTHTVQDTMYNGEYRELVDGYQNNNISLIAKCEDQLARVSRHIRRAAAGPDGYGVGSFCRDAMLSRNGSELLNRSARPVMERLGVPLVEADLIVKDQAWATHTGDGRHYAMLVPVEVWTFLGVLVSMSENDVVP